MKAGLMALAACALAAPAMAETTPSDPFVQDSATLHLGGQRDPSRQ